MFSARQFRELILALLGIAVAVGIARAQPASRAFWTVEARVAQADQVIVGTISKVSRKTLVAPGGADKIGTTWTVNSSTRPHSSKALPKVEITR